MNPVTRIHNAPVRTRVTPVQEAAAQAILLSTVVSLPPNPGCVCADCGGPDRPPLEASNVADRIGQCNHCGAIEVVLDKVTGFKDFSSIGESNRYPTGYGCELCS